MSDPMPFRVHSRQQTRQMDAALISSGIAGIELMERAAQAAWQALLARWPDVGCVTVLCGAGNNAGDGYLLARLALAEGWRVHVWTLSPPERLTGDAAIAWQQAQQAGVSVLAWTPDVVLDGVVVDALLGTGLTGAVRAHFAEAIAAINNTACPVLAIDVPSGLDADRGVPLGAAVQADATVTFITLKLGLLTALGPDFCGELIYAALAEPLPEEVPGSLELLQLERWRGCLPARTRSAHKGSFGHLLLVGGGPGMGGAIMLAAEAALCSGAGKVSVATCAEHVAPLLARSPEVMVRAVASVKELAPLLATADALVVGPGLGRTGWAEEMLSACLEAALPRVLDADALNLLAQRSGPLTLGANTVITPHPAEAARLLGCSTGAVQSDRLDAVQRLIEPLGCHAVLKGVGSLVASPVAMGQLPAVCGAGNPGMAVGGMGDVLSGLLGALLAQRVPAEQAARYAVLVHALAGDMLALSGGEVGIRAGDMMPAIRRVLNQRGVE
ncbi:bifunctional NAD(P)H-hydrate repair enzyme [Halopseudomonas oceani]|uniref:Bifunctional NAD(P)H-hydrate repair enzyme n=1 Tax=Halopseudomonas oceani TaxID=1708783 RepID=A0A2P4EXW9_9GAMM|nr:NAD(P)H-hydrate dehydratase [Halopseudomonas oceani]POB05063.1 bifunctional ADP-dependent NAD(P)H-hydrate dehydratase/NAD(P)H-hydrate epimerase [Halopseudomonas oceani]GGE32826.1 bifunctional NAD(P)H-hydrate repair enzyme [Halopseudomonas oceani]